MKSEKEESKEEQEEGARGVTRPHLIPVGRDDDMDADEPKQPNLMNLKPLVLGSRDEMTAITLRLDDEKCSRGKAGMSQSLIKYIKEHSEWKVIGIKNIDRQHWPLWAHGQNMCREVRIARVLHARADV